MPPLTLAGKLHLDLGGTLTPVLKEELRKERRLHHLRAIDHDARVLVRSHPKGPHLTSVTARHPIATARPAGGAICTSPLGRHALFAGPPGSGSSS